MKHVFFVFLLIPAAVFAQLDRVRTNMTEQEFIHAFPEAIRDKEAESGWVGDTASYYGIKGEAQWKFSSDTVVTYRFNSVKEEGPSEEFPNVDSSKVHALKVCAELLRRKIEISGNKPSALRNVAFTAPNPMNTQVYYLAEWLGNDGSIIRITVTEELSTGNRINAPVSIGPPKKTQSYELNVHVTQQSIFTRTNFSIGKAVGEFLIKYPHLKDEAKFTRNHFYLIPDSAVSSNAKWKFYFLDNKFAHMSYDAWVGTEYGAKSEKDAYDVVKRKADQLLADGNKNFGTPDSLVNKLPSEYVNHESHLLYRENYLYNRWIAGDGFVVCELEESGGGKNPASYYHLSVSYRIKP